jgi:hypothetical protein
MRDETCNSGASHGSFPLGSMMAWLSAPGQRSSHALRSNPPSKRTGQREANKGSCMSTPNNWEPHNYELHTIEALRVSSL